MKGKLMMVCKENATYVQDELKAMENFVKDFLGDQWELSALRRGRFNGVECISLYELTFEGVVMGGIGRTTDARWRFVSATSPKVLSDLIMEKFFEFKEKQGKSRVDEADARTKRAIASIEKGRAS
jgi:hypothetical protein